MPIVVGWDWRKANEIKRECRLIRWVGIVGYALLNSRVISGSRSIRKVGSALQPAHNSVLTAELNLAHGYRTLVEFLGYLKICMRFCQQTHFESPNLHSFKALKRFFMNQSASGWILSLALDYLLMTTSRLLLIGMTPTITRLRRIK